MVTHNLLFQDNVLAESVAGMRDAGPEVIALQEVTPGDARRLVEGLGSAFPFHAEAPTSERTGSRCSAGSRSKTFA